jgi:NADPH2:quinone reductase
VIGIASAAKSEVVQSLGIAHVDYGDDVADQLRALTAGKVDAVYDLVGGDALRNLEGLLDGTARLVSAADPAAAAQLGGARLEHGSPTQALAVLAECVKSGELDLCVGAVFPFHEAPRALRCVEQGHATGKIAIVVP